MLVRPILFIAYNGSVQAPRRLFSLERLRHNACAGMEIATLRRFPFVELYVSDITGNNPEEQTEKFLCLESLMSEEKEDFMLSERTIRRRLA